MANQNDQKSAARAKREQAQRAAEAAAKRNRNLQILGGILFAAVLVVVLVVVFSGGKSGNGSGGIGEDDKGEVAGIEQTRQLLDGVDQRGLTIGDADAPVTVIEFIDVQCPFCRDSFLDEMPTMVDELVRTGKAKIRLAPLALTMMGEDSVAGRAVMLRLADEGKAWNFTNLFYHNQGTEATGYVTDEYLRKLVVAAGADAAKAAPRTPDAEDEQAIQEIEELAEALRVNGTPSYAVGKSGSDPRSYEVVPNTGSAAEQIAAAVDEVAGT